MDTHAHTGKQTDTDKVYSCNRSVMCCRLWVVMNAYIIMSAYFLQPVDFQGVVVSDNSTGKTYAIFTYNCTSSPDKERYRNSPDGISATIGIGIPNFIVETFRYSNTPYAVELRCLNILANETLVNLVYDLNPPVLGILSPGETDDLCSMHRPHKQ